jgi:hypothetical protein
LELEPGFQEFYQNLIQSYPKEQTANFLETLAQSRLPVVAAPSTVSRLAFCVSSSQNSLCLMVAFTVAELF